MFEFVLQLVHGTVPLPTDVSAQLGVTRGKDFTVPELPYMKYKLVAEVLNL